METVKEKIKHAIANNDGPELDAVIHAWCAGQLTSNEFDDILAAQRRINEVKEAVQNGTR